ncbi:hypothetical protein QZH41_014823, partial [Actinostola sp. cb2023]
HLLLTGSMDRKCCLLKMTPADDDDEPKVIQTFEDHKKKDMDPNGEEKLSDFLITSALPAELQDQTGSRPWVTMQGGIYRQGRRTISRRSGLTEANNAS